MSYRSTPSIQGTTSLGANYPQEPEHDEGVQDFIDEIDGLDWGIKSDWGPDRATIRAAAADVAGYLAASRHFLTRGDSEEGLAAISKCLASYPHVYSYIKNTL